MEKQVVRAIKKIANEAYDGNLELFIKIIESSNNLGEINRALDSLDNLNEEQCYQLIEDLNENYNIFNNSIDELRARIKESKSKM